MSHKAPAGGLRAAASLFGSRPTSHEWASPASAVPRPSMLYGHGDASPHRFHPTARFLTAASCVLSLSLSSWEMCLCSCTGSLLLLEAFRVIHQGNVIWWPCGTEGRAGTQAARPRCRRGCSSPLCGCHPDPTDQQSSGRQGQGEWPGCVSTKTGDRKNMLFFQCA